MRQEEIEAFKKLGQNISKIRSEKGITLEYISTKTKIKKEYLEKIEKGEGYGIMITEFFLIAEALDVLPHVLAEGL